MHSPSIEILPLKRGFLRAAADATHVLVRIVAPSRPATEATSETVRAPLDLALVIDRSGSMSGEPLKAALDCAVNIFQGLRSDDRISIVAFDDEIDVVQPLAKVGDIPHLPERIRQIESGGSTALFDGWQEGVKQLAPFLKKERIARVILLTDGQANQGLVDETKVCAQVAKAAGAGITTSTVGLGHGFNEELLTGMAKSGEGVANFGQTADDLGEAFEEQFSILSNTFLRQVQVSIQGGSDVQARLIGETADEDGARIRKLGTLPWAAALTAVVELKVGAAAQADSLLAVSFSAFTKEGLPVSYGPQILALPELDLGAFTRLTADVNVAAAVSEAITAEQIEAIETLLRAGGFDEAKRRFAELAKREGLSSWAKEKIEYLRDLLEQDRVMAMKEMRYASRGLTRSIRSIDVHENAAVFDAKTESVKALYLQKKLAVGRRTRTRPTPPPTQA